MKYKEWTDIKDGLPEKYKKVRVFHEEEGSPHYRDYAEWSGKIWTSFDLNGHGWKRDNITHWMPLPPAPKAERTAG